MFPDGWTESENNCPRRLLKEFAKVVMEWVSVISSTELNVNQICNMLEKLI